MCPHPLNQDQQQIARAFTLRQRIKKKELIASRCEEAIQRQVFEAIKMVVGSADGIKRTTRAGIGLCHGKSFRVSVHALNAGVISVEKEKAK